MTRSFGDRQLLCFFKQSRRQRAHVSEVDRQLRGIPCFFCAQAAQLEVEPISRIKVQFDDQIPHLARPALAVATRCNRFGTRRMTASTGQFHVPPKVGPLLAAQLYKTTAVWTDGRRRGIGCGGGELAVNQSLLHSSR
jgi:hypothetical protein